MSLGLLYGKAYDAPTTLARVNDALNVNSIANSVVVEISILTCNLSKSCICRQADVAFVNYTVGIKIAR